MKQTVKPVRKAIVREAFEKLDKLEFLFIAWDDEDIDNTTVTPVVKRTDVTKLLLSLESNL